MWQRPRVIARAALLTAAILALTILASCTGPQAGSAAESVLPSSPYVTGRVTEPFAMLQTAPEWVRPVSAPFAVASKDFGGFILAFHRGAVADRCVQSAKLWLYLSVDAHHVVSSLAVYPASVFTPLARDLGSYVNDTVLSNRPRSVERVATDALGWHAWDVTPIVDLWVDVPRGKRRGIPARAPVVLEVRPPRFVGTGGSATWRFASITAPRADTHPFLEINDCQP